MSEASLARHSISKCTKWSTTMILPASRKPLAGPSRKPDGYVPRRWLALARGGWIVLALLLLANFVASIPAYYRILQTVCTLYTAQCTFWQPTPGNIIALQRLHLPIAAYAAYFVSLDVAASLLFWIVGILIFWRKSNEWMGLFVSLVLIFFGSFGISDTLQATFRTPQTPLFIQIPILLISLLQWPALGIFLLTFPTGRFAPRWSWLIVLLWIVQFGFFEVAPTGVFGDAVVALLVVVLLLTWGSTLGIQVYRYVRVYDAVQRQQVKWFVFACLSGFSLVIVGNYILGGLVSPLNAPDSWFQLLNGTIVVFLFVSIPLAVGIAILRYRLWDIDVIINRTLVYGSLTALLALVYIGLVIGLQALVHLFTGQLSQSPVAIVISTLVIAALFQPLRKRIQTIIDRRFYRSKYDAAKTVAAFSATLRNEVDLDQLREHLLDVVQETMQPAHVSLWLRPPQRYTEERHRLKRPHTKEEGF